MDTCFEAAVQATSVPFVSLLVVLSVIEYRATRSLKHTVLALVGLKRHSKQLTTDLAIFGVMALLGFFIWNVTTCTGT